VREALPPDKDAADFLSPILSSSPFNFQYIKGPIAIDGKERIFLQYI